MASTNDAVSCIPASLLDNDPTKAAFSKLTEIHQAGYLDRPRVIDESRIEDGWLITISTSSPVLGTIVAQGQGGGKALAKTCAASLLLKELQLRE
jgi:hypothetical protein